MFPELEDPVQFPASIFSDYINGSTWPTCNTALLGLCDPSMQLQSSPVSVVVGGPSGSPGFIINDNILLVQDLS